LTPALVNVREAFSVVPAERKQIEGGFMSSATRSLIAGILLAAGFVATTANAHQPRVAAARPVEHRPNPGPGVSPTEAARIRFQVNQHHQMQRRANSDGGVSRREQAALARDAAQVRHLIKAAKTN
jgi:hypothetical protein